MCLGAGRWQREQRFAEIPRAVLRAAISADVQGSDPPVSLFLQGSLPMVLFTWGDLFLLLF